MIGYGLFVLLSNTIGLVLVLVAAYAAGIFITTVAMVLTLLLLRPTAGGAHCSNIFNCNLFGLIFILLASYATTMWLTVCSIKLCYVYLFFSTVIALVGILSNAPYFTQNKPRAEKRRKELKYRSLFTSAILSTAAIILLFFRVSNWALGIANGLLFQGFMLLPLGIKGTELVDSLINKMVDNVKRR